MKRIFTYILIGTLATGFIGCEPDNPEPDGGENPPEEVLPETLGDMICGEWHHESEDGTIDIYMAILPDGTHELYQKFSGGVHHLYRSTWTLNETVLEGTYNDQAPWQASYNISLSEDKTTLTLTAVQDIENVIVFVRKSIPDSVRDTCIVDVKS